MVEPGWQVPMARSQASGVRGHAPPEIFKKIGVKWCILRAIYYIFADFLYPATQHGG